MTELVEPAFLLQLRSLERRLRLVARSGRAGERQARRRGSSAEFEQHRPHVVGDDPRLIDWLATARSGTLIQKLFKNEEDPVVQVLLDCSASLSLGSPQKIWLAKRLCAAVGHLALADGARLQLVAGAGTKPDAATFHPPRRGRAALFGFVKQLDACVASGPTKLAHWVREIVRSTRRPGLLVVVSDFLDPEPVARELDVARGHGHDVALFQILALEELDPELEGDLELEDVENGARIELSADPSVMQAYLEALSESCERLRAWARQRGLAYVRLSREEQLLPALSTFVLRGQD
jgi:uncharacterized protein (DUF58 family)